MTRWEHRQAESKRRKQLRERAVRYLGGCCAICGYDKCISAFDFHHVEVWLKDFTISAKMSSWEKIEPELKKCVLLCSRCHREVHDGLHPSFIEYEESNKGGDEWQLDMFDLGLPPMKERHGCLGCPMVPTERWPAGECEYCGNMVGPP